MKLLDYRSQAETARKDVELLEEKVGLLNRLAEIEELESGEKTKTGKVGKTVSGDAPKRRGRPPKSADPVALTSIAPKRRGRPPKNADPVVLTSTAPKRRGRPPKNPNAVVVVKEKRIELPSLLQTIVQTHGKPMKHEELVVAARQSGYKSGAADFSNMVYQCLVKLVKKGTFAKANEGKNAEYTFRNAS